MGKLYKNTNLADEKKIRFYNILVDLSIQSKCIHFIFHTSKNNVNAVKSVKFWVITEGDVAKLLNSNLFEIAQLNAMPI